MVFEIPKKITDITPDWLSEVLSLSDHRVTVGSIEAHRIGHGMMSNLYGVTIVYVEGEGPLSVAVKLPTDNQQNREVAITFDNYRREMDFYQHVAKFSPMRIPKAYLALSSAPDEFVLVMEDLSDWQAGDQAVGCSLREAEVVMDALADLHAAFWCQVDTGTMDWMPNSYPSIMSKGLYEGTAANYENFSNVFSDLLTPELQEAKNEYLEGLPTIQSWINDGPRTVIHGDFRLDNLFFKTSDNVIDVACCDWQASIRGKGIHDVAYFLSGNLDPELRREYEQHLIKRWVDALESRGIIDYAYERAFSDYRKAILALWSYVVNNGGLATEDQRDDDWVSAQVQRHAAAMTDHDCLALL